MTESFTTNIGRAPAKVHFNYEPGEAEEEYYPGCPSSAEIHEVFVKVGGDVKCVANRLRAEMMELLEERAVKHVENQAAVC